jgi:hypothetical protein
MGCQRDGIGRLCIQESSSPEQPPARDAPEERGARIRGGLSGDPGKEEAACPLPGTGDPVTWARRTKMRFAPDPEQLELTKLLRQRGGGKCSNPERFAHGQRRTAQFAYAETRRRQPRSREVAWDSSREEPRERGSPRTLTLSPRREGGLARQGESTFPVREEGERSRRIRKAFVRRQRRKREPEGGPERRPACRQGNRSRRTSHPPIQSWCAT